MRQLGRRKLDQEGREVAVRMYRDGKSTNAIAEKLGVTGPTVSRVLKEEGVSVSPRRSRVLTPSQETEVVALWEQGAKISELATRFGCSIEPIKRVLAMKSGTLRRGRHGTKRLLPERWPEVVAAYTESGASRLALAVRFGTYPQDIERILTESGVDLRDARYRRGDQSPLWKGRQVRRDGYVMIPVAKDHPFVGMATADGLILEHRLVMAGSLGRPLLDHERVHHRNGVRDDNRIENLELWAYSHPPGQRDAHCPTCTCFAHQADHPEANERGTTG